MWNNSYRTPTECWQKTSDLPKGKELPMYLGRAKEKRKNRQKNRDGTCISGRELWRRKSFHTLGSPFTGGVWRWAGGKLWSHRGEHSNRGAEGKAERFPQRGSLLTSTHQPERLVCSPTGAGGSWELRLELRRSDPRGRTEVGCVNTTWRGLVHHSEPGGSPEKFWTCRRGKRPLFWGARGEGIPSLSAHRRQTTTKTSSRDGASHSSQLGPQR